MSFEFLVLARISGGGGKVSGNEKLWSEAMKVVGG
jgi:hypothetical protein